MDYTVIATYGRDVEEWIPCSSINKVENTIKQLQGSSMICKHAEHGHTAILYLTEITLVKDGYYVDMEEEGVNLDNCFTRIKTRVSFPVDMEEDETS